MDSKLKLAFRKLKKVILSTPYVDVYLTYGNLPCTSEGIGHPLLYKQYLELPASLNNFVSLFLLGRPCLKSFLSEYFSEDELNIFIKTGIMHYDGCTDFITSKYVLMPFMGYLIFFERRKSGKDIAVYMGEDSLALATHLMPPRGSKCLDLCSGSGIQALLCSSHAKSIVTVDLQEEAVKIASINTYLNSVENKVKVRQGNLYEAVKGEKFDFICANPPLLPAPNDLRSPLVAGAGEDGLFLTIKILEGLPDHLENGGRCQLIGTCLGDKKGPFITRQLNTLKHSIDCHINIVFPAVIPLKTMIKSLAANSSLYCSESMENSREKYKSLFNKMKATCMYPFFLNAFYHKGEKPSLTCVTQYRTTKMGFWYVYF